MVQELPRFIHCWICRHEQVNGGAYQNSRYVLEFLFLLYITSRSVILYTLRLLDGTFNVFSFKYHT